MSPRAKRTRARRPLASLPDGAELISEQVRTVVYDHVDEPEGEAVSRVHDFGRGVQMWVCPDGSVVLRHAGGRPLWRED